MVSVVVGQNHGHHVAHRPAQLGEGSRQLLEVARETTVDDGYRSVDFVEIPGDPVRAEPIDTVSDLVDGAHGPRV